MPALLARSRDLARKALMTSGPAPMFSQSATSKGRSSRPASFSWICWKFSNEEIFRRVPGGTFLASGAFSDASSAAAPASAQPLSPAAAAVTPSREVRKSRRSRPGAGGAGMGNSQGMRKGAQGCAR